MSTAKDLDRLLQGYVDRGVPCTLPEREKPFMRDISAGLI